MTVPSPLKTGSIVVFDLDGTLVDSARDLIATLNRVIKPEGLPALTRDHVGHLVGHGSVKMLEKAYAHYNQPLDTQLHERLHREFLTDYAEHIADETTLFEGVPKTLEGLKAEGWILAVCTNKYERMSIKLLEILGISGYFSAICGSDTFPVRKPDPKHLWATIEQAGGQAKNAIMIGDSATDVNTARAANIPVIGVPFGYTQTPMAELNPDSMISHFDEMIAAIHTLAAKF